MPLSTFLIVPDAILDIPFKPLGRTIRGTADKDILEGSAGDDHILGYAGNDTLKGGAGDDLIETGTGNNLVFGGSGDDLVKAGKGADLIFGEAGNDILYGVDPASDTTNDRGDLIAGGDGDDQIHGFGGDDLLLGGADDDTLWGDWGKDELRGDDGDDLLYGGAGNDRLIGGAGNDRLDGGAGDDILIGGFGSNILHGGAGADRFVLGQDARPELIDDYSWAEGDRIDLTSYFDDVYGEAAFSFVLHENPSGDYIALNLTNDTGTYRIAVFTGMTSGGFVVDLHDTVYLFTV